MSKSPLPDGARGFTLLEVMIATSILVIGVTALASLATVMLTRGRQSKYINLAGALASEKLEDLSRWNPSAQQICIPDSDTSEGSLTSPISKPISCFGETASNISYFDDVNVNFISNGNCSSVGTVCFAETVSSVATNGTTTYYTTYHSPSGMIPGASDAHTLYSSTTAPASMTFHRTWLIEANTPVSGTRRITVLVTLTDQSVKPGVSFQMSMVRQ